MWEGDAGYPDWNADADGQKSATCAAKCPSGSLCPEPATHEAQPCVAGSYCPEGSAVAKRLMNKR